MTRKYLTLTLRPSAWPNDG